MTLTLTIEDSQLEALASLIAAKMPPCAFSQVPEQQTPAAAPAATPTPTPTPLPQAKPAATASQAQPREPWLGNETKEQRQQRVRDVADAVYAKILGDDWKSNMGSDKAVKYMPMIFRKMQDLAGEVSDNKIRKPTELYPGQLDKWCKEVMFLYIDPLGNVSQDISTCLEKGLTPTSEDELPF